MTYKALFISAEYKSISYRQLDNIKHVVQLADHIKTCYNMSRDKYEIITDNASCKSSHDGILSQLYKLGLETWSMHLDTVFIYYTGDSINICDYVQAYNGKYSTISQGIVPCDYNDRGVLDNDKIYKILELFNPKTKIIFVADSCFLDSNIFNLEYDWFINNNTAYRRQNKRAPRQTNHNIITISCNLAYYKTDDENYYTVLQNNENMKSIADFMVKLAYINDNIFDFVKDMNSVLMNKQINMLVSIASSYDLSKDNKNIFECFGKQIEYMDVYECCENYKHYNDVTEYVKQVNFIPQTFVSVPLPVYNVQLQSVQPIQTLYECYC